MKNTKLVALALGALVGAGIGCRDSSKHFRKEGTVNGYRAIAGVDSEGRKLTLWAEGERFHAVDVNNDGRFDQIFLRNVPMGSPLENYASIEAAEKAYQNIAN